MGKWSCFTQWRLLVLIPVEERWGVPFSFLQTTCASVDLPPVDTGQFLSPSHGPQDALLGMVRVWLYFGGSWLGFMSERVCKASSPTGTWRRKCTGMWWCECTTKIPVQALQREVLLSNYSSHCWNGLSSLLSSAVCFSSMTCDCVDPTHW